MATDVAGALGAADQLEELLAKGQTQWPLPRERPVHTQLVEWSAFRETNRHILKQLHPGFDRERHYVADPLAERIAEAFADLLFGADIEVTPAADSDQDLLDE